jgi:hypothetical protein
VIRDAVSANLKMRLNPLGPDNLLPLPLRSVRGLEMVHDLLPQADSEGMNQP